MKGLVFQAPLEISVEIEGESWPQGSTLSGTLSAKNRGSEPVSLDDIKVRLAHGDLKKVHKDKSAALETQSETGFDSGRSVAPGAKESVQWSFETEPNCPITDKSSSLFLSFGQSNEPPEKMGHLQLNIAPQDKMVEFVERMKISFRFVEKTRKFDKGNVLFKMAPPSGKSFAHVDNLMMRFRTEGEKMIAKFTLKTKKIDAEAGMSLTKSKQEIEREWQISSLNPDSIENDLKEIVDQIEAKDLLQSSI